jgi:predicted transposase YdaD
MKDSVTYQAIVAEGREQGLEQGLLRGLETGLERGKLQEAIKLLKKLGSKRFGPSESSVSTKIDQITDLSRIEQFFDRLLDVNSWEELLTQPEDGKGAG